MKRTTLRPNGNIVNIRARFFLLFGMLVCLAILGQGCGKSSSPEPLEAGTEVPDAEYLKARGTGTTEAEARKQAMAELSGIFESRVHSEFVSASRSSMAQDRNEAFEKHMASQVRISSDMQLQGARIHKTWKDEETGLYNALAVLDRLAAGQTWASRVGAIDSGIRAETAALEDGAGVLSRMAGLNRIIGMMMERRVLESRLRVVDYPVMEPVLPDMDDVMADLARIKSALTAHVEIQGDGGERSMDVLSQGLTRMGISLVENPEEAGVRIKGRIEMIRLDLGNPDVEFVRARASIRVADVAAGSVFARLTAQQRKGHKDPEEAGRRAVESASGELLEQLAGSLGYDQKR